MDFIQERAWNAVFIPYLILQKRQAENDRSRDYTEQSYRYRKSFSAEFNPLQFD